MIWRASHRFDREVLPLADRHYNRQHVGSPQFAPPGRCLVLKAGEPVNAFWITSWPFAEFTHHAWAGAWVCSAFRNEGAGLSSALIREALAATRARWPAVPALGMITFIDRDEVRHKRDFGRCYRKAGFADALCPRHHGPRRSRKPIAPDCAACRSETQAGLVAVQLFERDMPRPESAHGAQLSLLEAA